MTKCETVMWRWREPRMFTSTLIISPRKTLNISMSQNALVDWGSSRSGIFTVHDDVLLINHTMKTKNRKQRIKKSTTHPLRTNTKLNYIYRSKSYRAVSTPSLSYKNHWVNLVWENIHSVCAFAKSLKVTITSFTSAHSVLVGPIFKKFYIPIFFRKSVEKI
jgi:hypothetical protein